MAMRLPRLLTATALVCVLSAALVPASTASNWAGNTGIGGGCASYIYNSNNMADNASHDMHYYQLTTHMQTATNWTIGNNINPTDLNAFEVSTYNSYTDVLVFDAANYEVCGLPSYPTGDWIGFTLCGTLASNGQCQQHRVYYENTFSASASEGQRRSLTCHEQGHALGLNHRYPSAPSFTCMDDRYYYPLFDSHDIGHLNTYY